MPVMKNRVTAMNNKEIRIMKNGEKTYTEILSENEILRKNLSIQKKMCFRIMLNKLKEASTEQLIDELQMRGFSVEVTKCGLGDK